MLFFKHKINSKDVFDCHAWATNGKQGRNKIALVISVFGTNCVCLNESLHGMLKRQCVTLWAVFVITEASAVVQTLLKVTL